MVPCLVLFISLGVFRFVFEKNLRTSAQWSLAIMLLVTASAHYIQHDALVEMLPPELPARALAVSVTGVMEIAFACLLFKKPTPALGWILALFLVSLLPANIYSALAHTGMGGHGASYLWFRVPFQILLMSWAVWCTRAPAYKV